MSEARVCFQYYQTIIKLTLRVLDEETDFSGKQPDRKLLLSDLLILTGNGSIAVSQGLAEFSLGYQNDLL